jgi:hypothetical protein
MEQALPLHQHFWVIFGNEARQLAVSFRCTPVGLEAPPTGLTTSLADAPVMCNSLQIYVSLTGGEVSCRTGHGTRKSMLLAEVVSGEACSDAARRKLAAC